MAGDVGIEWVKKYHGRASDLTNTKAQAQGFYNKVDCYKRFNYGNDSAWDQDFEAPGVGTPSTGIDYALVDAVDIVFFSGHGSQNGPFFGVADHDDGEAKPTEVRWGDKDLEWIAFDACRLLSNAPTSAKSRWKNAFQGLHYILGFKTTCSDEKYRGTYFAKYLNKGWRVKDAWIKACQLTEGSGTHTAYIRADLYEPTKTGGKVRVTDTYKDHLWGHGYVSPDPDPETAPGKLRLIYYSTPC
jgi:hypothetical protein